MSAIDMSARPTLDDRKRAADGLCEVLTAIDRVDYNSLHPEEALQLLAYRQHIEAMTLTAREDHH